MRNTYGGQINRLYTPNTSIPNSFSGIWNMQEHYELRREGNLGYGIKYHPSTVLHIGGGYETIGDTNIIDLTGHCEIINNVMYKDEIPTFFSTSVSSPQGVYYSDEQIQYGNCSVKVNKLSNYVVLYNDSINIKSGSFTVEWWEYRFTSQSANSFIRWEHLASGYAPILLGYYNALAQTFNAYMSVTGLAWAVNAIQLGTGSFNKWNHYAVVRNVSTQFVYTFQNGTLRTSASLSGASNLIFHNANLIHPPIQGSTNENLTFEGYFQDFCISKRAKYSSSFTPTRITE